MNIEQEDSLDKEYSKIQEKREETRRELAKVIEGIQDGIQEKFGIVKKALDANEEQKEQIFEESIKVVKDFLDL